VEAEGFIRAMTSIGIARSSSITRQATHISAQSNKTTLLRENYSNETLSDRWGRTRVGVIDTLLLGLWRTLPSHIMEGTINTTIGVRK
jgi:hypothetical protein